MEFDPIFVLVLIGAFSIVSQLLAYRMKIPSILLLLLSGVLLGPGLGILNSDLIFGDLLFPIVTLSVAIILFEGALSLSFNDLGSHGRTVRNLCTAGTLITWIIVAPAAHYIVGISWEFAFLFSAIVTVTGPTVVIPMIRAVRPSKNVAQILRWEGIIIDPIGAILAVLVFEFIVVSQNALAHTLIVFGKTVLLGTAVGLASGYFLARVLHKGMIPAYLVNTAVLTTVLVSFQLSNLMAHESGLLAVTVMGVWLANHRNIEIDSILEFKETLSVLLISGLFIILAARIELNALTDIALSGALLLLVIMFIARPVNVLLSTLGSKLRFKEKILLIWMAPRGIVAAAVSALFALKLELAGFDNAGMLVTLVFFVIVSTVTIQSLTSATIAGILGEREPETNGYLVFGGNEFGIQICKEIQQLGFIVKYADTNWASVSAARMEGIPAYFGNPSSEHARRTMNLTGIGHVLVLSPYKQLNPIVTQYFQYVFGDDKVMGISLLNQKGYEGHHLSERYARTLGLFGDITYSKIASKVAKGATIKRTSLTESFNYQDYKSEYNDNFVPLYFIDPKGKITFYCNNDAIEPSAGCQIVSLVTPEAQR